MKLTGTITAHPAQLQARTVHGDLNLIILWQIDAEAETAECARRQLPQLEVQALGHVDNQSASAVSARMAVGWSLITLADIFQEVMSLQALRNAIVFASRHWIR